MLGELDGIAHQVGQHLFETQGIEQCVAACGGCDGLQARSGAPALENTPYRFDQCCKVNSLRRDKWQDSNARDVEKIADH